MRSLFGRAAVERGSPDIRPISVEAASDVRLSMASRFTTATLGDYVRDHPNQSFYSARTGHYVVAGPWRRRTDIGYIVELSPGPWGQDLIEAVAESFRRARARLLLIDDDTEATDRALFRRLEFEMIDEIIEYEKVGMLHAAPPTSSDIRLYTPRDLNEVLAVERQSFPWLWWNSAAELTFYCSSPLVRVFVMPSPDGLAGYVGITLRGEHAHLDRLAVRRDFQQSGLGTALVAHAIDTARARGVRHMTLTTQHDNRKSQTLYRRFGFRLTQWRYRIDGIWIGLPPRRLDESRINVTHSIAPI